MVPSARMPNPSVTARVPALVALTLAAALTASLLADGRPEPARGAAVDPTPPDPHRSVLTAAVDPNPPNPHREGMRAA